MTATHEPPRAPVCLVQADKAERSPWPRFAQYGLVLGGAAAAAFGGLVAEDLFPDEGHWFDDNFRTARIIGLVVSLLLALIATWLLTHYRRNRGTLYYLRFQNETNPDYHEEVVDKARSEYLDFRSVSAWCDPGIEQEKDSGSSRYHVVDVRKQLNEMSAEFQRTTNDDAGDSGFDIAPNLLFPAALALGYEWMPPGEATLREFNKISAKKQKHGDETERLTWRLRTILHATNKQERDNETQQRRYAEEFQWKLHKAALDGKGATTKTRISNWLPAALKQPIYHFDANAGSSFKLTDTTEYQHVEPGSSSCSADQVRSVWLEFRLSQDDYSGSGEPEQDRKYSRKKMSSAHKDWAEVLRVVQIMRTSNSHDAMYSLVSYTSKSSHHTSGFTVLQIAEGVAFWLAKTLREFPNATVFVAGAMPKTMSFAAGYMINRVPPSSASGPYHPWRRIVPMGHFMYEEPELRPMWVRDDQIDPNVLIERAFGSNEETSL